jgi:hypothetical protein
MRIDAWDYGDGKGSWAYSTPGHVDSQEFFKAIEDKYGEGYILPGNSAEHKIGGYGIPYTLCVITPNLGDENE